MYADLGHADSESMLVKAQLASIIFLNVADLKAFAPDRGKSKPGEAPSLKRVKQRTYYLRGAWIRSGSTFA